MISLILIFLARAFKALSDITNSCWDISIFKNIPHTHWFYKWAGPGGSWRNKWKLDENGDIIKSNKSLWYYLWIYNPGYIERFPYSSTFLVRLTDLWHTSESMRRILYALAFIFMYVDLSGWHWWGYEIPYVLWFWEKTLATLILNLIAWVTVAQLTGFTLFYDYVLKRKK